MAEVYSAHDEVLDRNVALKVLSRRYANDEEFVERFKREAKSAAALSHPNIVPIYDRGQTDEGSYYIAMEYVPGGTLKDRIRKKGSLPPEEVVAIALQIARALQAAHRRNLIHRDIKPHNVLLTESADVKVADFGIARAASATTITRPGLVLGSVPYLSPEQARGESVGPQSDLYSLGVVLYEMLTAQLPYDDAKNPIGTAAEPVKGHPRPPKEINPDVPAGLNAITMRLLAEDRATRYAGAAELIDDLGRVSKGLSPAAPTTQVLNRLDEPATSPTLLAPPVSAAGAARDAPRRRREASPWGVVVAILLLGLILSGIYLLGQGRQNPNPQDQRRAFEVPNLQGSTQDEAEQALSNAGLNVTHAQTQQSSEPAGTVLRTDPPAGSQVEPGTSVTPIVSSGPPISDEDAEEDEDQEGEDGPGKGKGKGWGKGKGKGFDK